METQYSLSWSGVPDRVRARFATIHGSDDACWPWPGSIHHSGYGVVSLGKRRQQYAHRVAWCLANEGGLFPGEIVAHHCDNPICVNPAHLLRTDQAWNMRDKMLKGRVRNLKGEAHPRAKLTDQQVAELRRRRAVGEGVRSLAVAFGVSAGYVSKLCITTARR